MLHVHTVSYFIMDLRAYAKKPDSNTKIYAICFDILCVCNKQPGFIMYFT